MLAGPHLLTPRHTPCRRNAYNLVLHKHGDLLYAGVTESVSEHLQLNATRVASEPDDQLLAQLTKQWEDHKITMVMIRDILMYMVRALALHVTAVLLF